MSQLKKYAQMKNFKTNRLVVATKLNNQIERVREILIMRGRKKYGRNFTITKQAASLALADRIEELLNKRDL
jgi:coproporphyrinogen III oxidase-like Fe-S oxidoreductase